MKKRYFDLLITNQDLSLDSGKQPIICDNRVSIAQDIKHAIIESGLATLLIAERSRVLRQDIILQLVLLVEEDRRLIPGTIFITDEDMHRLRVTAETYEFGKIDDIGIILNERTI